MSCQLAVFDLDGTLNRTDLYAVAVHQQVQKEFGFPVLDRDTIISVFGARSYDYMRILLPGADEETQQRYGRRAAELELEMMQKSSGTFDGVSEMLDELHRMGFTTAVCSNASARYINATLAAIGIAEKIDEIQPLEPHLTKIDTLRMLLERLEPVFAVMVGDRSFDLEAARENHLPFIGCAYGYCPSEIQEANAIVTAPLEIPQAVRRLCCR